MIASSAITPEAFADQYVIWNESGNNPKINYSSFTKNLKGKDARKENS